MTISLTGLSSCIAPTTRSCQRSSGISNCWSDLSSSGIVGAGCFIRAGSRGRCSRPQLCGQNSAAAGTMPISQKPRPNVYLQNSGFSRKNLADFREKHNSLYGQTAIPAAQLVTLFLLRPAAFCARRGGLHFSTPRFVLPREWSSSRLDQPAGAPRPAHAARLSSIFHSRRAASTESSTNL
jgi:hypothetical protein